MSARDCSESPFGETCTPSFPTSIVTRRCNGRCSAPFGPLTLTVPPETVTSVLAGIAIGRLASLDILFIYQISNSASPPTRFALARSEEHTSELQSQSN